MPVEPAAPATFREALAFWFKLGWISFGGPAGQIAIMHAEVVERRRWISEKRFLHALNYCMVLPGPEAQQLATYLGWLMHRTPGGIAAGALFVLPSLLILIILSWLYLRFGDHSLVAGMLYGIKPAVVALIAHAAYRLGSKTLTNPVLWSLAICAALLISFAHLPFPALILGAGVLGWILSKTAPTLVTSSAHASKAKASSAPAWLDDDSPRAAHTFFRTGHLLRILGIGFALWTLPFAALYLGLGKTHLFTEMAWFFSKAALLTFGGAYAVLPYVYQGAVIDFRWLSAGQMMDGLALGETTPGPLIMIVVFVAFVGAYLQPGTQDPLLAAICASLLVTWFTFLPSCIFILAGGPLVESSREQVQLTGPLTAISASVVGVIVSLAVLLAMHVFWPNGLALPLDWIAVGISLLAAALLIYFKRGVIEVILTCAALGIVRQLSP